MTATNLKIRFYGDPCLRQKAQPVKDVGTAEKILIKSMILTMQEARGIGLAAPQVGINKRIFVLDIGEGPQAFIDPQILRREGSAVMEEGCLSLPDVNIPVKRAEKIVVQWKDENNEVHEKAFEDLTARVIQHENDHLNGKLIIDYLGFLEKRKMKKALEEAKLKAQKDSDGTDR